MQFVKAYTPADASLTGFASNVTGATWTLSATTPNDNLAHQVTIRNDSATNHSAKTATLVGTDADGNALTESMAMPGSSATVTSTKFFRTLTTVTPSSTISSDTMDIGWAAAAQSQTIGLEKFSIAPAAVAVDISGTINFSVQETPEDFWNNPQQNASWIAPTALSSKTADTTGNSSASMRCLRVSVNSFTAGATLRIAVAQSL